MSLMDVILEHRVFAVVRAHSLERALECAEACVAGGIKIIEITLSFPLAATALSLLSKRGVAHVGAGTVISKEGAQDAQRAGAEFIVCPHTDPEIIRFAKENGLAIVAGALTSNEIVNAWKLGADMVKVFPARQLGGAEYIRSIKEPLPFVRIMATGGVTLDDLGSYFKCGAAAAGLSSALFGKDGLAERDEITKRAKKANEIALTAG